MKKVPLVRALSKLGLASRTEATELIREGRVKVDGKAVLDPAIPVVPERVRLLIDGAAPRRAPWTLVAFHKPRGVVTTRRDPEGRPTVYDFLRDLEALVVPIGRLDFASSGLLLLTNDTRLADRVTDPASAVVRHYVVTVRGALTGETARRLEEGIDSPIGRLEARRVAVRKRSRRETHLVVDLVEGKNREIRRLLAAFGHEVTRLKRMAVGGIELGDLPPGRWRRVSSDEARAGLPRPIRPDRPSSDRRPRRDR